MFGRRSALVCLVLSLLVTLTVATRDIPEALAAGYVCPATANSTTPTVINGTSYCFNTYSTAGTYTWTHPTPGTSLSVQLLIVGGGGAGGSGYGAGGGGGGAVYVDERAVGTSFAANLTVRVGAGGTVGSTTTSDGGDGASSSVTTSPTALTCTAAATNCAPGGKGGKGSPLSTGANDPTSTYGTGPNLGVGGATIQVKGYRSNYEQLNTQPVSCCVALAGGAAVYNTNGTYGWYSGGGGAGSGQATYSQAYNEWSTCCTGQGAVTSSGFQGYPPNSRWGRAGYPTTGFSSAITGTAVFYGSGGGGGNDMVAGDNCDSSFSNSGSGCGTNMRDSTWNQGYPAPRVAAAGTDGRGGGGGGGGKIRATGLPGFGAGGGSGVVIIRWSAPYLNDATVSWAPTTSLSSVQSTNQFAAASTTGNGAIAYSVVSTTATSCSVNSSTRTLSYAGVGNCVVRATSAQTATYSSAYADATFTFSRDSQSISWSPSLTLEREESPQTIAAASTTGNGAISYSVVSTTADSCSITSNTRSLTYSGTGTCVVRVTAAQTDGYSTATIDRTFAVVDQTPPTLVLSASSPTSTSSTITFTLTGNEPIACGSVGVSDFTLTLIDSIDVIAQTTSTRCTITASSSVSPGSSGTSSLRASAGFSVADAYGNNRTVIASGSPASVVVTIADVTAPVLTFAAVNSIVSGTSASFALTADEAIDCATVTASDFIFTNVSTVTSVTQSLSTTCTITVTASIAEGGSGVVTARASSQFSVEDSAGNRAVMISTGSTASVLVTVPAAATTTAGQSTPSARAVNDLMTATTVNSTIDIDGVATSTTTSPTLGTPRQQRSSTVTSPDAPTTTATTQPATTTTRSVTKVTTDPPTRPAPVATKVMDSIREQSNTAVVVNGRLVEAATEVASGVITVTIAGVRSSLTTTVSSPASSVRIDADGVLLVRPGEPVVASAQGLAGGAVAEVWLYSEPVRIGETVTDVSGAFVVETELPNDVEEGDHRLVVSGETSTGDEIAIVFAVRKLGGSSLLRFAASPVVWILLAVVILMALLVPNRLRRIRPTR